MTIFLSLSVLVHYFTVVYCGYGSVAAFQRLLVFHEFFLKKRLIDCHCLSEFEDSHARLFRKKTVFSVLYLYIQGLKDYAIIHTPQKRFVVRETMHALETLLTLLGFVPVHKSFIVAGDKLVYCSRHKIEFDGFQIPVGRTYRWQIKG